MTPDPRSGRTIGVALYGELTHDSRVRREATSLARAGHRVRIVCFGDSSDGRDLGGGVTILTRLPGAGAALPGGANPFWGASGRDPRAILARARWLRAYASGLRRWGRLAVEAAGPVDAWHVHDLTGLIAVAPMVPRGLPLVYDAHELFLEAGTAARLPAAIRWLLGAYERRLVLRVAAIVTVNDELAGVLRQRHPRLPVVVAHNCPERWTPGPKAVDRLREAARVPAGSPVILHHGSLGANRGIEQLMDVLGRPELAQAHLILMGPGEVREAYVGMAAASRWRDRIHVLDPVPPAELSDWIASADVGAMPIQRSTRNQFLSTPNKLFECLAAGVPVVASDFPGMRRVVMGDPAGPLGALCDPASNESIADALRSILGLPPDAGAELRRRCLAAAQRQWNWETQTTALLELYEPRGAVAEAALSKVELQVPRRPESRDRGPG